MQGGFSIMDALYVIQDEKNRGIIEQIKKKLGDGLHVDDIFCCHLPKCIQSHFSSFLCFLPFEQALRLALKLEDYDQKTSRLLGKSLMGPGLLLVGCLIGIQLFNALCYPALINLMRGFEANTLGLQVMHTVLTITTFLVFGLLFIFIAVFVYFASPKRQVMGYIIACRLHLGYLLCHFMSGQFAYYFNECVESGCMTQKTLLILQRIKKKPLLVFLAYHVEQALLKGETIEIAMGHRFMDPSLQKFMQIAVHSSSLKQMLNSYITLNQKRGQFICRRWSQRITAFAYATIGILVLFVYQILLLPLSIMGQM